MADIFLGNAPEGAVTLPLGLANRHGLIAGATGTGKTVSLQTLVESFSNAGVPVFVPDVKGDLSGMAQAGGGNAKVAERFEQLGIKNVAHKPAPVVFWDVLGKQGHPLRATITDMGPLLLSRLLDLSDAQEGMLQIAFAYADQQGWLLVDMKDLEAVLADIATAPENVPAEFGLVSEQSIAALQRKLLGLKQEGGAIFFGEPALDIKDLMQTTPDGRGAINILMSQTLMQAPKTYATVMLWLLSELFEELPEVGDLDKPKLVFCFDEAHLLFADLPKALFEKIEQVVRLVRSKGVGIYFITQNPQDLPPSILAQLGHRVQHALRAYTPAEMKALNIAAESFRPNPAFDTAEKLTQLGVGVALISVLQKGGVPDMVRETTMLPPSSRLGAITEAERATVLQHSPCAAKYSQSIDSVSAYEQIRGNDNSADNAVANDVNESEVTVDTSNPWGVITKAVGSAVGEALGVTPPPRSAAGTRREASSGRASNRQGYAEALVKSMVRTAGSQVGRAIIRGVLGSLKR